MPRTRKWFCDSNKSGKKHQSHCTVWWSHVEALRDSNNPSGVQSWDRRIVFCRLLVHILSVLLWFHQRWNSRRRIDNAAHNSDRNQTASRSNVTTTVFLEMYVFLHRLRVPQTTVVSSRTYELKGGKKLNFKEVVLDVLLYHLWCSVDKSTLTTLDLILNSTARFEYCLLESYRHFI
jgi:hypothetical protein